MHLNSLISAMARVGVIFTALVLILILTRPSLAMPEFSGQTGEACSACHVDPDGGSALTAYGERFEADGYSWDRVDQYLWGQRMAKMILGFIHILFSVTWFGSIIYVHLIIKPQTLIRGLPKSEKLLGRICIIVVGITGIGLTLLRLQDVRELWTTTFGLIWIIKVSFYVILVVVAAVATTAIDKKLQQAAKKSDEPLADGKDGRPAHVIFEDWVYDVTDSKMWKNGIHMKRHFAGADLSASLKNAPHGPEVLERVKDLGSVEAQKAESSSRLLKLFVGLAYFVLFCVFIILLCVAWWRWGPPLIDSFPA